MEGRGNQGRLLGEVAYSWVASTKEGWAFGQNEQRRGLKKKMTAGKEKESFSGMDGSGR